MSVKNTIIPLAATIAMSNGMGSAGYYFPNSGNPPKQFGMSYKKNQKKLRKQKRQIGRYI